MVYRLKDHVFLPIAAQVVGESLENIRQRNGGVLTPAVIVEKAKLEDSVLHPCFEWNDAKAAEAHRLNQARYLLRSVVVVYEEGEEDEKTVRAFVTVKDGESEAYNEIHEVMQNPEYREQVLVRAKTELKQWVRRYENLEEFGELINHIHGWDEAA